MQPEDLFNAPIPGQSLTQDPESRGPHEMPPKFTTTNQVLDHFFKVITGKDFIKNYAHILSEDKKFYIDKIVVEMLTEGFMNGLWTPDLMLLVVEPLTIMMIWAAAQLDRSPSFSGDTGYEDRTGFEDIIEMVGELEDEEPQEAPQEPQEPMEAPEQPVSPLTSDIPQSPLTGGM